MKKSLIGISTALILIFFGNTAHAAFTDVLQTHNNYVAINFLEENDIIDGYKNGSFKPENLINRAEALKVLLEGVDSQIADSNSIPVFSDVSETDWFAPYVAAANDMAIISGNPDGTFAPGRNVNRAELIKMILELNNFNKEKWDGIQMFPDVPEDSWFTPYMNYAGQAGLILKDDEDRLNPGEEMKRGEVAEIMYIMEIILSGADTDFLILQAEKQMAQIDIYIDDNNPQSAKRASDLGVDMTQQAYKNLPQDNVVLGEAKLARAYNFLVNAYMAGIEQKTEEAVEWANKAIAKADEAWEVNNETQPLSKHIKDRAGEIIAQSN